MIRVTQTYLNHKAADYFTSLGWKTIYVDLPGGRRSGIGITAEINAVWEKLYNLSPDIVLIKEETLLLLEVDNIFSMEYVDKLKKFYSKKQELLNLINQIMGFKLSKMEVGFVSKQKIMPEHEIEERIRPVHFLYLEKEVIKEVIL